MKNIIFEEYKDPVLNRRLTWVLRYFKQCTEKRALNMLLDLGCGQGEYFSLLTKENMKIIGFDISSEDLKIAKTRSKQAGGNYNCDFIKGDLTYLPFINEAFDVILCLSVLEHLNKPENLVQEIKNLLKNEGIVIINVPWLWDILFHPMRTIFHRALDSIHNGCPNFFAKIIFSGIDNLEGPILRRWVLLLIWNDSKREHAQNYVKAHLNRGLKHLDHKHWFTPNEWIEVLQSCGLIIMNCTGSYVVPPGVRRLPITLRLFFWIEDHLPNVIRKWLGQSFVIVATKKPKMKSNSV